LLIRNREKCVTLYAKRQPQASTKRRPVAAEAEISTLHQVSFLTRGEEV